MGSLALKAVSKSGSDTIQCSIQSLKEVSALNIDGVSVKLADLMEGKKCIMVVNVASN